MINIAGSKYSKWVSNEIKISKLECNFNVYGILID